MAESWLGLLGVWSVFGTRSAELILGLGFLALPLAIGCLDAESGPVDGAGLTHAHGSPEALARAVLRGLEHRDRAALERLLVTREEHRELLWEELPERSYFTFGDARSLNERNTRRALTEALARFGGHALELESIEFTGRPEVYKSFTLQRGARLTVRDPESGRVGTLPILNVVLERDGLWKLMHFDD
jgi:hypothetical protein